MIATDYSEGMICEALKGNYPKQLKFEVADATCLPYENNSFDVVIIANAAPCDARTAKGAERN